MEQLEKILIGLISKQFGLTEADVSALLYEEAGEGETPKLKDDVLKQLLDKDAERVKKLKGEDKTEIFNNAYAKAKKEEREKIEKYLQQKYKVEPKEGSRVEELIDEVVSTKAKALNDEDKIKTSKVYLSLERQKQEEIDSIKKEYEQKIEEIESGYKQQNTLKKVRGYALSVFDSLNPILPKDATKAAKQREIFARNVISDDFQFQDDGGDFIILKGGKRLEDEHGNPITVSAYVKQSAADLYEFAKQGQKGSPGLKTGANGGGGADITVPANEEEYNKAILEEPDPEKRAQIVEAYEASKD